MINPNFKLFALSSLCAWSASALAAQGGSVGNGGQTIVVDGKPTLRDLADRSLCDWTPATAWATQAPYLDKIYASLDRIDPIYADLLRTQAQQVNVCVTAGKLIQIDPNDLDGVTVWEENGDQVAVRINDSVFLNHPAFAALDDVNRAYLVVHELMHAFVPAQTPQRNTRMRSFVNLIRKNEQSPVDRATFLYQMRMDLINWPSDPVKLPFYNQMSVAARVAADTSVPVSQRLTAGYKLDSLQSHSDNFYMMAYGVVDQAATDFTSQRSEQFLAELQADDVASVTRDLQDGLHPTWTPPSQREVYNDEPGKENWKLGVARAVLDADHADLMAAILNSPSADNAKFTVTGVYFFKRKRNVNAAQDWIHLSLEESAPQSLRVALDSATIPLQALKRTYPPLVYACLSTTLTGDACATNFVDQALHFYGNDATTLAVLLAHPRVQADPGFRAAIDDVFSVLENSLCKDRPVDEIPWTENESIYGSLSLSFAQRIALARVVEPYLQRAPLKCYKKRMSKSL